MKSNTKFQIGNTVYSTGANSPSVCGIIIGIYNAVAYANMLREVMPDASKHADEIWDATIPGWRNKPVYLVRKDAPERNYYEQDYAELVQHGPPVFYTTYPEDELMTETEYIIKEAERATNEKS